MKKRTYYPHEHHSDQPWWNIVDEKEVEKSCRFWGTIWAEQIIRKFPIAEKSDYDENMNSYNILCQIERNSRQDPFLVNQAKQLDEYEYYRDLRAWDWFEEGLYITLEKFAETQEDMGVGLSENTKKIYYQNYLEGALIPESPVRLASTIFIWDWLEKEEENNDQKL